jgi:hypothetical protein
MGSFVGCALLPSDRECAGRRSCMALRHDTSSVERSAQLPCEPLSGKTRRHFTGMVSHPMWFPRTAFALSKSKG